MPFNTPQKKWAPNRSVDNSQLKSPMSNSPRQLNSSRITPDRLSNTVHFNRYSSMNGSMSPMGMSCPRFDMRDICIYQIYQVFLLKFKYII